MRLASTPALNQISKLEVADSAAMEALGQRLAQASDCGLLITLQGNLGSGKTTLARGFISSYGHQGVIRSPTFTLVEPYEMPGCSIYHFDLYRLADPDELEFLGVRDYFNEHAICLIEWPDKAGEALPQADIDIHIDYSITGRTVSLTGHSPAGNGVLSRIMIQNIQ